MKAVLMNQRYRRGMLMMLIGEQAQLALPLLRTMSAKLLSVAFTGIKSGGSLTVEVAGVSAVLNSQYSGNRLTMATIAHQQIKTRIACGRRRDQRRSCDGHPGTWWSRRRA